MSGPTDFSAAESLAFQGRITASVSHELKNVLATISETAGLLADLVELGETGRPLDTGELRSCSETIVDQVKRGFRVVKSLNAFAHSADERLAEVALSDLVELVAGLADYLSFASPVELQLSPEPGPKVTTRPLLLEDLVYRCLVLAFREVGPDRSIGVAVRSDLHDGQIVISGLGHIDIDEFVNDDLERLMGELNVSIRAVPAREELQIVIPILLKEGTKG